MSLPGIGDVLPTSTEKPSDPMDAQAIRKSNVRINVTYLVIVFYSLASLVSVVWLLSSGKEQIAMTVFAGYASLTAGIVGFWFGNRSGGLQHDVGSTPAGLIGPTDGTARRPGSDAANPETASEDEEDPGPI